MRGVATGDMGIAKDGTHKPDYQPGMELHAQVHALRRRLPRLAVAGADGSASSCATASIRRNTASASRSCGRSTPAQHQPGLVMHSQGWPLDTPTGGGSFIYHFDDNSVAVGFVVHLNYANPHLSPYDEFQRFKTASGDPRRRSKAASGIAYGARAINEGGLQSVPQADVSRRRADRLRGRLREPAAHQGLAQRDEDRHARRRSGVRGARRRRARTTS